MKILIAGGAGFIGSNLTRFFLSKKNQVTVVDNLITGREKNIKELLKDKNFRFILNNVEKYKPEEEFDICFHLASPASPPFYQRYPLETISVNTKGTENLLKAAKEGFIKRFIFASTSEVYGDPLVHPQPETYFGNVNPVGPRACYDESKRLGETLCFIYQQKFNLDIRIARIFNTYGPFMRPDDGRVITNFIIYALKNKPLPIYGKGEQTRSFCFITDMVEALTKLALTDEAKGEVINLGNPNEITVKELAKKICEILEIPKRFEYLLPAKDDPQRRRPDISKAKRILNWQPKTSLEEGLKKTINYLKTELK